MTGMWPPLLSWLSPAGARGRLSILIFHRVLPQQDALFPDEMHAQRFDQLCGWLKRWFQVLPLGQAVTALQQGTLPTRALAITFDDGYADNHDVAMPILQRHGLSATFYIATGFLDGGRMFNDTVIEAVRRSTHSQLDLSGLGLQCPDTLALGDAAHRRAAVHALLNALKYRQLEERLQLVQAVADRAGGRLPDDLMMCSAQVQALRQGGMTIGAHTVSHPILAVLDEAAARQQIEDSRAQLQNLLGERVAHFAYPNGVPGRDFTDSTAQLVRSMGFDSAVTTGWGAARGGADLFQLPRFTPWDQTPHRFAARMARNLWAT
jgi:peptidoglycan/xylan/chitin deacetylase (PgdA/CDA1 family)